MKTLKKTAKGSRWGEYPLRVLAQYPSLIESSSDKTSGLPASGAIQQDGPILHVVDQSILDIAREFRFTVEEVQEHYDRCGAMERTRARFKKMRDTLSALADDSDHAA